MKTFISGFIVFLICGCCFGQSVKTLIKYPAKGKQLIIDGQEVSMTVEGYNGSNLIIEPDLPLKQSNTPVESVGLSLISPPDVKEDNLIHFNVLKNEEKLFSIQLLKSNCRHVRIKVPNESFLKINFKTDSLNGHMLFKHLDGELELSGTAQIIELNDIKGPVTISAAQTGGRESQAGAREKIIVTHLKVPKNDPAVNTPFLNIITTLADVDISLPSDINATVRADLRSGNLYSDLGLVPEKPAVPPVKSRFTGKLNRGSYMIVVKTDNGNVFLRQQK